MLQVRFLGQFDVRADGKRVIIPSRAGQSLFAFLILSAGTAHRREKLAGQFWPDTLDENARANLRRELWRMRKAFSVQQPSAAEYLLADELTIGFNPHTDYWLDAAQLQRPLAPDDTLNERVNQVSLYQGELLPGFYEDWVVLERQRVQALFESRIQELLQHLIAGERWAAVLEWSERWIAHGQTPEPAYRALMLAHAASGDRSKVAATFERCASALREDLGVEPSEETRRLYEQLLEGKLVTGVGLAGLHLAPARMREGEEPPAPGISPFKGLQYFEESDARLFFGREALTAKLVECLRSSQLLAVVVGASGSGKSSLVRAGVVPALKNSSDQPEATVPSDGGSTNWQIHVITPTAHPLQALATELTRDVESVTATATLMDDLAREPRSLHLFLGRSTGERAPRWQQPPRDVARRKTEDGRGETINRPPSSVLRRVLLVVDQFEELFTLCHDEFEREAFVDNLLLAIAPDSSPQLALVLTIRADFYAHLAQYPELRKAVAEHQEYIGPMTGEELKRAIEEPALGAQWEFERGLVDLILRDVGDEPGALPLLSHALLETWKRRSGRTLTFKGYWEAGGVRGAIAHTAETVYQQLNGEDQKLARDIFLRLTQLGEGTEDTKRRAPLDELITFSKDAGQARALLNTLAEARLLTLGESTAEVAHEAVIREWPTLREWLSQDREGLRLHRHLTEAAHEWRILGRDPGALYRGARLAQASEWASTNSERLNELERAFLEASKELEEREQAEREAQRQRELDAARELADTQARAARQLRRRAVLLGAALAAALVMAAAAVVLGQQASSSAVAAEREQLTATSRELAAEAVSNLDADPQRSLLLALRAVSITYSVDGTWTTEAENALHRAVLAARVPLSLSGQEGAVSDARFSPDGKRIATNSTDGKIKIWDAFSGKQLLVLPNRLPISNGGVSSLSPETRIAFSAEGSSLTALDQDDSGAVTSTIWDLGSGQPSRVAKLSIIGSDLRGNAFSPDATRIATSQSDGTVKVWDAGSGKLILTASGQAGDFIPMALTSDGTRLAFGGSDNIVHVWDLTSGHESRVLNPNIETAYLGATGQYHGITALALSLDGTRLAAGLADTTIRVWDVVSGKEVSRLCCDTTHASAIAFSPDGTRLASGGPDGNVITWDVASGRQLTALVKNANSVRSVAFSPDGLRLAVAGENGGSQVWDLAPGSELSSILTGPTLAFAQSPDGYRFATSHPDNQVRLWNAGTGGLLLSLAGHNAQVRGIAFSPDGTRLATASLDHTAKVWDVSAPPHTGPETGKPLATFSGHTKGVNGVAFSPDGRLLATAGSDLTAKIWDLQTNKQLMTLEGASGEVNSVAFSPDGTRVAGATLDGWVKVWDLRGKLLISEDVHMASVRDIRFSPDGKRLVTASLDGTARVMDAATGRGFFYLFVQTNAVYQAVFSADGSRIATANGDGTASVWDTMTGKEMLTLSGHTQGVTGVGFSTDGTRLVTASADGTVLSYVLPMQDLINLAKSRLTRTWTVAECQKFLHLALCPAAQ